MISGFDYGTSNCAMGVMENSQSSSANRNSVKLLPIADGRAFMPSTLYALERELICESVGLNIADKQQQQAFIQTRSNQLAQAQRVRQRENIANDEQCLFFGEQAFEHYLAMPEEGYFVKSPKSFLGASGLRTEFVHFFEDIVTAMMQNVKQRAEQLHGDTITHTVIGRPVNFQGLHAEQSNRQALEILSVAAQRAGFSCAEFLYEPLAAAMDFERGLQQDKCVLVVDIGGGTTDCSMVNMGPSHINQVQREADFLGHSGERVGGNDLDIHLAEAQFMPLFGSQSKLNNGLPMPGQLFWNAVATNDIAAQSTFYGQKTSLQLQQLLVDAQEPMLIQRLIDLREEKQNYHLIRSAEQLKIALSGCAVSHADLDYIEQGLGCDVSTEQLAAAIDGPLSRMMKLMQEVILQAGRSPDLVYVTGGSARSPILQQAIATQLGDIDVIDGDHFGSVATGLTVWAERIYR